MPAQFWSSISNLGAMVGRDEYEASMLVFRAICPKLLMKVALFCCKGVHSDFAV